MRFWERTWIERTEEIKRVFGETWPPEDVISFSWTDRIRCPGACALVLPPTELSSNPIQHRRDDWLYLTMGLSQPIDEEQLEAERHAGKLYSAYGIELGFLMPEQCDWTGHALYGFVTHITDGTLISWGDRFAFGLTQNKDGEIRPYTGDFAELGIVPLGNIRAALFWRYLFDEWELTTSTGKFMILVATGITQSEWEFAKQHSSYHLQLLLCRAGIGQRTIPDRECIMNSPNYENLIKEVTSLAAEECDQAIEARASHWNLGRSL